MSDVTQAEMLARASEVVYHAADCPGLGRGDEHCRCGAVPFLDELEKTFLEYRPTPDELRAIHELSVGQDLSAGAVIRQAIRQYQSDYYRRRAGETCSWSGDEQRARDFAGTAATSPGPVKQSLTSEPGAFDAEPNVVERVARALYALEPFTGHIVGPDWRPDAPVFEHTYEQIVEYQPYAHAILLKQARAALSAIRPEQPDHLEIAARELLAGMFSTYRGRNGRETGIEADDGEKCWIVHSDLITALEVALPPIAAHEQGGE